MNNVRKAAAMSIVFDRERGRCYWCERVVRRVGGREGPWPADMATLDHIIPRSQGGSNLTANLVLACHDCNQSRGTMPAEGFLRIKRAPGASA